jgi:hypothetical protein
MGANVSIFKDFKQHLPAFKINLTLTAGSQLNLQKNTICQTSLIRIYFQVPDWIQSFHNCIAFAVALHVNLAVELFNIPALVEFIRIHERDSCRKFRAG